MTGRQKIISNPGQAFGLGASWGTPSIDTDMTTERCDLINNTGGALYTGDVVSLDPTGTLANLPATGSLTSVIGCVGSALESSSYPAQEQVAGAVVTNTFPVIVGSTAGTGVSSLTADGNVQPFQLYAWVSLSVGFTNGNGNLTSSLVSTNNPLAVGLYVITPYNASTNANPQIFQVTSNGGSSGSWTAVASVISGAGTTFTGTTGSFTCQVGRDTDSKGPGWSNPVGWSTTSAFPPNAIVPVVVAGFGRVNINGLTTMVFGDGVGGTNASAVGTRFAYAATGYASACGLIIAVALEAYAQRDTTINDIAGISGHNSIRAIIGKM